MRISWIAARCYALLTGRGRWVESCRALAVRVGRPGVRRLLDVGTGPGTLALAMEAVFPGAAVVGLDASRRMLTEARRKQRSRGAEEQGSGGEIALAPLPPCPPAPLRGTGGRVLWVCGDAARLPFRAGVFDGAAGHSVLYLTAEPEEVLREVKRVLGPGGRAGFVEPRARVPGAEWRSGREGLRFLVSMLGWRWVSRSRRRYEEVGLAGVFRACGFCEVISDVAVEGFGVCGTGRKA